MPDEKIINRTISFFESVLPMHNKYIILLPQGTDSPKRVNERNDGIVQWEKYDTESFWKQIGSVESYDKIVIHFLSYEAARFINTINHEYIYWIEWGADLYNVFLCRRGFKLYNDERLVCKMKHPNLNYSLYKILHKLFTRKRYIECYKAIKKIKYFVPDSMYDEYPLFLEYYPEFSHLQYKNFFYYPIDVILGRLYENSWVVGYNLLLGNSCSYTNNHIYVMNYLKEKGIHVNIIAPLSYGGDERYKNKVKKVGKKLFGENFHPVEEFMAIEEYNKILLSCNSFIFGSLRQEAVGNILIALYVGGRVFLQSANPLLKFYKSMGLVIFSLDEIETDLLTKRMAEEEVFKNRKILNATYSSERMKKLILTTFLDNVN